MNIPLLLRIALLSLLSFGLCTPAGAEIYRWAGTDGKVHFSDKAPQEKDSQQVESFQGGAAVSFFGGGTGSGSAAKVRIFVTQSCPYCKKAKAFLHQRGTLFDELDVEKSYNAKAEYKRLGGAGVPIILVGKQRMDGFNEAGLQALLIDAGL